MLHLGTCLKFHNFQNSDKNTSKFGLNRIVADSTAKSSVSDICACPQASVPDIRFPSWPSLVCLLALKFPAWPWQASLPALRFPSWPSGLHPSPHRHLRLPLEGLWTREAWPDVSTGGLLCTYPTHISESKERSLKNPMTNARPGRPPPLATLLDFHIVCIINFSRSNYNL